MIACYQRLQILKLLILAYLAVNNASFQCDLLQESPVDSVDTHWYHAPEGLTENDGPQMTAGCEVAGKNVVLTEIAQF